DGMSVRIVAGRSDRSLVEVAAKAAGRSLDLRVVGKVADESSAHVATRGVTASSARRDVAKAVGRNGVEIATRSVLPSSDLRTAGKAVKRVPSVPNDAALKPDSTVAEIAVPRPGAVGTRNAAVTRPVRIVATLGRRDRNGTIKDFPGLSRRIPT
ncbi:MAG: hypothetical protein ABFC54_05735, partial [Thermoguttaceae bacterium]